MQSKKALNLKPKTFALRLFSQNFGKPFVTFEIDTLKFVKKQSFVQKQESLTLEIKLLYLSTFRKKFEKLFEKL